MAPTQKYVDITITYNASTGEITVSPDPAQLYWAAGPDSARWKAGSSPSRAASFDIEFEHGNSPFRDSGLTVNTGVPALIGTGNLQVAGKFKYTVVFRDVDGNQVASKDPMLQNGDNPP